MSSRCFPTGIRLSILALLGLALQSLAQSLGPSPAEVIEELRQIEARFKTGDTNVPLLTVTVLGSCYNSKGPYGGCSWLKVEKSGKLETGWVSISNPGPQFGMLDSAKLKLLTATIQKLQSPTESTAACWYPVVLGAVREGKWFQAVYDQANLPKDVQQLFKIAGKDPATL